MAVLKNFDYSNKQDFIVQFLDKQVKFDVSNPYTRKWFLPRYDFGKIHEPLIVKFMCRILNQGDTFFDLGAHIGYFSIIGSALGAKTYAFELDDNCIPIIEHNIKYNSLKNVNIINKAVSNVSDEVIKISSFETPNTTLSVRYNPNATGHKEIKTITLSDFCKENKVSPKLIKMDIEGAEYDALEGMLPLMEQSKDLFVLMEVHPKQLNKKSIKSSDIVKRVNSVGYKAVYFGSHRAKGTKAAKTINPSVDLEENTMFLIKR